MLKIIKSAKQRDPMRQNKQRQIKTITTAMLVTIKTIDITIELLRLELIHKISKLVWMELKYKQTRIKEAMVEAIDAEPESLLGQECLLKIMSAT